jgi:hypothetical protein
VEIKECQNTNPALGAHWTLITFFGKITISGVSRDPNGIRI